MSDESLHSRERLAWTTLLGSFFLCAFLTISVPILLTQTVRSSTQPLQIESLANQGTVVISNGQATNVLFAGMVPQEANMGETVITGDTDTALLLLSDPDTAQTLGRIELYANSNLEIEEAIAPRFSVSEQGYQLKLILVGGRARINLLSDLNRPISFLVNTPHALIDMQQPGSYSVETTNLTTQVAALEGEAIVSDSQSQNKLLLFADQRARVDAGSAPVGPLQTERNLIQNGDFQEGFADWLLFDWQVELADQPRGETALENQDGAYTLIMRRVGNGHADVSVRQLIQQDVTNYESLTLSLDMRINQQTLAVCGQKGSECPITVRVEYEDMNGAVGAWQQGFFAIGNVTNEIPNVCTSCPPPLNPHLFFTPGQLIFYESGNILEQLRDLEIDVRQINNISLVAQGHGFDVEVVEVAVIAKE